jgi:asparagine synthase (glutamine-hydrolysing)
MCGICGFVGKGDIEDLVRMNACLVHRGPDAEGLWYDHQKAVYFGHRRLSIIDIAGGAQPMWSGDKTLVIVFNGEIYNHEELRKELIKAGHRFLTDHSDTEVLIYGYKQWGQELVHKLNGMWAFALYDRTKDELFLSRDRFGKKPLFYTRQNGTFAFASELSALIKHSNIVSSISRKNLKKYFAYGYISAPNSLYEHIYKLPGGHNLTLHLADPDYSIRKYWDFLLEPFEKIPKNPEEEWGEHLLDLLEKAVKRRLMSDVPIGVFLSGGIDSSSITAFAAKHVPDGKLKTFSIGFQETSFDETKYGRIVADLFETDHHQEILSIERARDILPEIMAKLDEPMGDSSLLPTYLLCRETRKHVTVTLGGDGADELFAGYDPFRALQLAEFYSIIVPRPVHQAVRMAVALLPVSHRNMSLDFKLKRMLRGLSYPKHLWNSVWLGPLEPKELDELFQEPIDIEDIYSEAIEQWEACPQDNIVDKTLQFYTKLYLQDDILVKADRASMMNSLEVRAPFLDMDVVDFVRRIPHSWKYRNGQTKYILKKALEPVLPHNILYRSKKGFGVPVGKWLQEGLVKMPVYPVLNVLNIQFVERAVNEHIAKKNDHRAFLWNLRVLSEK